MSILLYFPKNIYLHCAQCNPFCVDENVLLMGDAAHAMVPFFGQGMNAGFEDCSRLSEMLDKYDDIHMALRQFSSTRWQDAHAICDLAMYNYIEVKLFSNYNNPTSNK